MPRHRVSLPLLQVAFCAWITVVNASFVSASTPQAAAKPQETIRILALGDSLTEGYNIPAQASYPAVLQRKLHAKGRTHVEVINAGISGATTASGAGRLRWYLKANQKPQIVILALGANDGLRGLPLEKSRKNLEETISLAQNAGLKVILAGMKIPPNYGEDYTKKFTELFVELAEKYRAILVPFLLDKVAAEPKLNLPDGIHPNEQGYEIVADNVLPYVEKLL